MAWSEESTITDQVNEIVDLTRKLVALEQEIAKHAEILDSDGNLYYYQRHQHQQSIEHLQLSITKIEMRLMDFGWTKHR